MWLSYLLGRKAPMDVSADPEALIAALKAPA